MIQIILKGLQIWPIVLKKMKGNCFPKVLIAALWPKLWTELSPQIGVNIIGYFLPKNLSKLLFKTNFRHKFSEIGQKFIATAGVQ